MGQVHSQPNSNDISPSNSNNNYSAAQNNNSSNTTQYNSIQNRTGGPPSGRKRRMSSMLKNLKIEDLKLTKVDFAEIENDFKDYVGKGANGKVYEGKYQGIEAVAKICEYSGSDMKKYILNEIKWLSEFNHPNIVKIYAFAHKPSKEASGDGTFAFILEHGGDDLASVVKRDWITPEQIMSITKKVLKGLDYIHNFGSLKLIHRDIKPENIFVRPTGNTFEVKIGDFGIIRKTSGDNSYTVGGVREAIKSKNVDNYLQLFYPSPLP